MALEKVLLLLLAIVQFAHAFHPDEFVELSRLLDSYPDGDDDFHQTSETRQHDYSDDYYDSSREEYDDDYEQQNPRDNDALHSDDDASDPRSKREEYFDALSTKSHGGGAYRSGGITPPRPYKLKSIEDLAVQATDHHRAMPRTRRARLSDYDRYYPTRQVPKQEERPRSRSASQFKHGPTSKEVFERAFEEVSTYHPTSSEDFGRSYNRKGPKSHPKASRTSVDDYKKPFSTYEGSSLFSSDDFGESYWKTTTPKSNRPLLKSTTTPPSSGLDEYRKPLAAYNGEGGHSLSGYPTSAEDFGGSYRKYPESTSKSYSSSKSYDDIVKGGVEDYGKPGPMRYDSTKPYSDPSTKDFGDYRKPGPLGYSTTKTYSDPSTKIFEDYRKPGPVGYSTTKTYSDLSKKSFEDYRKPSPVGYGTTKAYSNPSTKDFEDYGKPGPLRYAPTKTYSSPSTKSFEDFGEVSSYKPTYPDPTTYSPLTARKNNRKSPFSSSLTEDGGSYAVPKPKDLSSFGTKGDKSYFATKATLLPKKKGRLLDDFPVLRSSSTKRKRPGLMTEENRHFLSATGHGKPVRQQFHEQGTTGPHSYKFGYNTGDKDNPMARYEERSPDGMVKGSYSYVDPLGKLKVVHYESHPETGFKTTL